MIELFIVLGILIGLVGSLSLVLSIMLYRKCFWVSCAGILIGFLFMIGTLWVSELYRVEIPNKEGIIQGNGTNLYIEYNISKNPDGQDDYIKTSDMICYDFKIKNEGESEEYVNCFLKYVKIEESGNVTHHRTDNISFKLNAGDEYVNKTCTTELIPAVYFLEMFFDKDDDESTTSLKSNRTVVTVLTVNDYTFIKTQRGLGFISIIAGIPIILSSLYYLIRLYKKEE